MAKMHAVCSHLPHNACIHLVLVLLQNEMKRYKPYSAVIQTCAYKRISTFTLCWI